MRYFQIKPRKFDGGIHPEGHKELSLTGPVKSMPLLEKYYPVIQQNIGSAPKVVVKKGDAVKKGDLLASPEGFISVPLHAPTSGTVGEILEIPGVNGGVVQALELTADGLDQWGERMTALDWHNTSREDLLARILACGVVGMGGAAFPTHAKLSPPPERWVDTLIVNGAECEPYLTADDMLMRDYARQIIIGALIAAKILKIDCILIGVEKNKPEAIRALEEASRPCRRQIHVVGLDVRYPQGGEKQLIYALTGRKVLSGGLPMDVGCVVQNVATFGAIYDAVVEGKPLIERTVTVSGTPVVQCGNYRCLLGTPVRKLLEFAGGVRSEVGKMIMGGPMMGFAQSSLDVTVSKNSSGVILLGTDEVQQFESGPCLSCGRCVESCPMRLLVSTLSKVCENERYDLAQENYVMNCLECGICTYVCPAGRPNVQHFRRAKSEIRLLNKRK